MSLEYQQYLEEWEKLPEACITSEFPLSLDIELTNRCNLRCLTGDTSILMADYTWKILKEIKEGDFLIGVKKPEKRNAHYKFVKTKVTKIFPGISEKIKKLTLENNIILKGTADHEILTKLGRWIPLKKIRKNREVYLIRIQGGRIEEIRFLNLCQPKIPRKKRIAQTVYGTIPIKSIEDYGTDLVYNIETDCNNYIANGLIVHNCNFCPHHGPDRINNWIPQDMDFELYKKIIDEGAEKGLRSVKLNYAGEPLLYDKLSEAIHYAKKKGLLDVRINTNAMTMFLDNLFDLDLLIITDYDLPKQLEIAGYYQGVKDCNNKEKPVIQVKTNNPEKWKGIADEIVQNVYFDYNLNEIFTPSDFKCPQPWQRFLILADGTVCSCSCGVFIENKILGNAWNFTLEELWTGKQMKFIRYCHEFGETHLLKQCRMCPMRKEYIKGVKK